MCANIDSLSVTKETDLVDKWKLGIPLLAVKTIYNDHSPYLVDKSTVHPRGEQTIVMVVILYSDH
jgi:hypothetical protein